MNDDIVTRLRRMDASIPSVDPEMYVSPTEAADEIERLRKWAEYEHAGYCGCAGGDPECVQRAYTTWRKMFDD